MTEVKAAGAKSAAGEGGTGTATPMQQDQTLALRLTPVNNSDQPVLANTSNVQLAPGVAHFDINPSPCRMCLLRIRLWND